MADDILVPGVRVRLADGDIDGIVTGVNIVIRGRPAHVVATYEVSFWDAGVRSQSWFEDFEVTERVDAVAAAALSTELRALKVALRQVGFSTGGGDV